MWKQTRSSKSIQLHTLQRHCVLELNDIFTHAQHVDAKESLKMLKKMLNEGTPSNYVTFVAVPSALDHMLVKEEFYHLESMANFGIDPGLEHYACTV